MFKPNRIILHCSATQDSGTVSWSAIRKYHVEVNKWSDIGYHFGIELIGDKYEILAGRMLNTQGAHCSGQNYDSIGICFVGSFDTQPPPREQLSLGLKLVSSLCDVFDLQKRHVFGHREFTSAKTCPGLAFNLNRFRNDLEVSNG